MSLNEDRTDVLRVILQGIFRRGLGYQVYFAQTDRDRGRTGAVGYGGLRVRPKIFELGRVVVPACDGDAKMS